MSRRLGAERQPDADLACALRDEVRHDPVEAHARQNQRRACEHAHQPRRETRLRRLRTNHVHSSPRRRRPRIDESAARIAARTDAAVEAEPRSVRSTSESDCCGRGTAGRYPDPQLGFPAARDTSPRRRRRRSTSRGCSTSAIRTSRACRSDPRPGQNRFMTRSLTIDRRRSRRRFGLRERPAARERDSQRAEKSCDNAMDVRARHVLRVHRRLPFSRVERRPRRSHRAASRWPSAAAATPGSAREPGRAASGRETSGRRRCARCGARVRGMLM